MTGNDKRQLDITEGQRNSKATGNGNLQPWRKGQSGNPAGRKPKHECLTSLLKEEIEKICPSDKQNRTWKELIIIGTMRLAMKGNAAALREVWERVDGRIKQHIGFDGTDGMEVTFCISSGHSNPAEESEAIQ